MGWRCVVLNDSPVSALVATYRVNRLMSNRVVGARFFGWRGRVVSIEDLSANLDGHHFVAAREVSPDAMCHHGHVAVVLPELRFPTRHHLSPAIRAGSIVCFPSIIIGTSQHNSGIEDSEIRSRVLEKA